MVSRRASFVSSCPGTDLGAQDRILDPQDQISDPQVNILARGPFGTNNGPEKSCFVEE